MTVIRHSPAPGLSLLLAPLAGAAAAAALYARRDALRPVVPAPWDDMLLTEAIIGQGFFVAALAFIAVEGLTALTRGRNAAWAGPARTAALTSLNARPLSTERADGLKRYHAGLRAALDRRWLVYAVVGLVPAFIGLVLGLAGLNAVREVKHPYPEFFTPLLVGSAEAGFLWAAGGLARWAAAGVLDRWLDDSLRDVRPAPKPPAPEERAQPLPPAPPPGGDAGGNGVGPEFAEKPRDQPRRKAMFD